MGHSCEVPANSVVQGSLATLKIETNGHRPKCQRRVDAENGYDLEFFQYLRGGGRIVTNAKRTKTERTTIKIATKSWCYQLV